MSSKIPWSLPEGVDEILPAKALQVEKFRRNLLDLYISSAAGLLDMGQLLGSEDPRLGARFTITY